MAMDRLHAVHSSSADFAVRVAGAGTSGALVPVAVWAQKGVTPLTIKAKVTSALKASDTGYLPNKQDAAAEVVVVQFAVTSLPARFELVFASGADNDLDDGAANKQAAENAAKDLYITEAKELAKVKPAAKARTLDVRKDADGMRRCTT